MKKDRNRFFTKWRKRELGIVFFTLFCFAFANAVADTCGFEWDGDYWSNSHGYSGRYHYKCVEPSHEEEYEPAESGKHNVFITHRCWSSPVDSNAWLYYYRKQILSTEECTPVTVPGYPATCTSSGKTDGSKCLFCNQVLVEQEVIPIKGHTRTVDPYLEPTCTKEGHTVGAYCSECGKVIVAYEIIPATGHTLVEVPAEEPTCTKNGLSAGYRCSVCGENVDREIIPAPGHMVVIDEAAKPATCTQNGFTEVSHCSVCNEILSNAESVPALGHHEVVHDAAEPTCTETGLSGVKSCDRCGLVITEQQVLPALGHDEVKDPSVASTCTETGLSEGIHCNRCGKVITAQEKIPVLGHEEVTDPAVEPSCLTTGLTQGSHCSRCNTILVPQNTVPALEHTVVVDEMVYPTSTQSGLTEGKHCSVCGTVITAQQEIAPTGTDIASGKCGTNLTWNLSDNGVLSISGSGTMDHYSGYKNDMPWYSWKNSIQYVVINEGVTSIGEYAFYFIPIQSLSIPDTLTQIGREALIGNKLKNISVSDNNPYFKSILGVLYNKETTELIKCPENATTISIPDSVTRIADCGFYNCQLLKEVSLPEGLTRIGTSAFSSCRNLTQIDIPASVTDIGTDAFYFCSNLKSITIPEGIEQISYLTGCSSLTSITIPSSVRRINSFGFSYCNGLTELNIPNSVTSIADYAFSGCSNLNSIIIPTSVTSMSGANMFANCSNVTIYCHLGSVAQTYAANNGIAYSALGHEEKTDPAVEPTCTETGLTEGKHCDICGTLIAQEIVSALGHLKVTDNAVEPTCIETGLTKGSHCSRCDAVLVPQEKVPALGHDEVTDLEIAATCTEDGWTAGSHCGRCDMILVKPETIPMLGHLEVPDSAVSATCTETGLTEGSHCERCGEIFVEQSVIPALGHQKVIDVPAIPATCTETGKTESSHCERCGDVLTVQETVPALGHLEVTDHPAVAATCLEAGLTKGSHCSRCGTIMAVQKTIAPMGHLEVVDPAVAPTCTETGLTEGKHCSRCGTILTAREEIAALGHREETLPGRKATCTESGFTEGKKCVVCGEILITRDMVPASGHHVVIDIVETKPGCLTPGRTAGSHCDVCNEILEISEEVPPLGHQPVIDSGVLPFSDSSGLTEGSHCSVCGTILEDQQAIPPTSGAQFGREYSDKNGFMYNVPCRVNASSYITYFDSTNRKSSLLTCTIYAKYSDGTSDQISIQKEPGQQSYFRGSGDLVSGKLTVFQANLYSDGDFTEASFGFRLSRPGKVYMLLSGNGVSRKSDELNIVSNRVQYEGTWAIQYTQQGSSVINLTNHEKYGSWRLYFEADGKGFYMSNGPLEVEWFDENGVLYVYDRSFPLLNNGMVAMPLGGNIYNVYKQVDQSSSSPALKPYLGTWKAYLAVKESEDAQIPMSLLNDSVAKSVYLHADNTVYIPYGQTIQHGNASLKNNDLYIDGKKSDFSFNQCGQLIRHLDKDITVVYMRVGDETPVPDLVKYSGPWYGNSVVQLGNGKTPMDITEFRDVLSFDVMIYLDGTIKTTYCGVTESGTWNITDGTFSAQGLSGSIVFSKNAELLYDTGDGQYIRCTKTKPVASAINMGLELPSSLNEIEAEAFSGLPVRYVNIPNICKKIGSRAFESCSNLSVVFMPDSVTDIDPSAFLNCPQLLFVCESNNTGARYARQHGIYYLIR